MQEQIIANRDYTHHNLGGEVHLLLTASLTYVRDWLAQKLAPRNHSGSATGSQYTKDFYARNVSPLLHSARLKPEVRAKQALLNTLAIELGAGEVSHRDLVVGSWVVTGGLASLKAEPGHTADLSGFVEGMLEATMCIAEFGDMGHHSKWNNRKIKHLRHVDSAATDFDEARARTCRAAAFLANMGVSTARKLECINIIAKNAKTYLADFQQKSLPFTVAAINNQECVRENITLTCSHL